ncbi:hypothetical protein Ndes2526B_g05259 [Nannochloris sp. 'desiccata']|nr:hypothetical protein KSW81_000176 [Chlorella desiccata (nom. nud.)]KAH7620012.1 putative Centromere/kinetochore protein zw10-like protein [Chlorella desiccata (nom. nud.)]
MANQHGGEVPSTTDSGVLDTLLASINTEGLTASSLEQSLSAISMRRDEVMRALLSKTNAACKNTATDAAATLAAEAGCAAALSSLQDRGLVPEGDDLLAQTVATAAQHTDVVAQLQNTLASISEVGAIAGLQQRLSHYDTLVSQGAFCDAAGVLLQLQQDVSTVAGAESTGTAVEERMQLFKEYVISAPPQYLVLDPASHIPALIPPTQQTGAALAQVWQAAAALGVLPNSLQNLSTFIVDNCVKAIIRDELLAIASANNATVMESPANSIASSALSAATTTRAGAARAGAERTLYRCFKSVCESALGSNAGLIRQLGMEYLWPGASGAYIAAKLRPAKPVEDSELAGFMRAGSLAIKLEEKAVKLGLWSAKIEGPIAKFVRQAVGRVLADKRVKYATAARDLLTSSAAKETTIVSGILPLPAKAPSFGSASASRALFASSDNRGTTTSTTVAATAAVAELHGEPPIGDVGPYAVSRAAAGLVSLMLDALGEACRSGSAALAQAMCGAVVDLASLLLALDPSTTDQERVLPYIAALRYNDCLHVYRTLCLLPQAHAPRLQSLVHPAVNFIAPARRVRDFGDAAMQSMVSRQRSDLLDIASELRNWKDLDGPGVIRCNKATRQLLAAFQRLTSVLHGVLPKYMFINVASELVNAVCGVIADAILEMGDISEDESKQIPNIIGLLTAPDTGIIATIAFMSSSMTRESESVEKSGLHGAKIEQNELAMACSQVARLKEVCELLDIPSREIALRWRSGRLAAVGLTKEQVVAMVRALFEDNEFSRASVNAILQS